MTRHASLQTPTAQRALLRAGLALTTVGAALGAGAATATAGVTPAVDDLAGSQLPSFSLNKINTRSGLQEVTGTVKYVTGPVQRMKPNPLAGTGADPLDNGVGTEVADFKPVTSQDLTRPVAQAPSVGSVPTELKQVTRLES
ncbi:hypothetical protein G5C60_45485 [Streptomyces sp. HC44]|uniref:Secreted protein n=1 Tax=Streptomyces scabichelini TaxID=2711217 RepID=A0A6G4VKM6_9ACTN|nr:hypothetical protein [Streptomyces scabichelini]NGO14656.1 hypothetical protein [Streptomyces scabichelini]